MSRVPSLSCLTACFVTATLAQFVGAQPKAAHPPAKAANCKARPPRLSLSVFDQETTQGPVAPEYQAEVIAQAKPRQKMTPQGLDFQLEIENPTGKPMVIHDLFDFLHIQLKAANGKMLSLPIVASRLERESGPLATPHFVPGDDKLVTPYKLNAVAIDGKPLSAAQLQAWDIRVPAHGDFEANVAIPRVMVPKVALNKTDENGELLTKQETSEFALPKDTYTVEITLALRDPDDKSVAVYRNYHPGNRMLVVNYGGASNPTKIAAR